MEGERWVGETLFETPRLIVRRLRPDDLDAMNAVYGDPEVVRWVDDGTPLDADGCRRWIAVTQQNYERRGYGMSAVVLRETGEVAGFCGIVHPRGQSEPEIKYALRPSAWGRGLATEAVTAMVAYGRAAFGLREMIATVARENVASQRVLQHAGFAPRGARPESDGSETLVFVWPAPESP